MFKLLIEWLDRDQVQPVDAQLPIILGAYAVLRLYLTCASVRLCICKCPPLRLRLWPDKEGCICLDSPRSVMSVHQVSLRLSIEWKRERERWWGGGGNALQPEMVLLEQCRDAKTATGGFVTSYYLVKSCLLKMSI